MVAQIPDPIIKQLKYSKQELANLKAALHQSEDASLIFEYPTVYVVNDQSRQASNRKSKAAPSYTVYIGETTNIQYRTEQHLIEGDAGKHDWLMLKQSDTSEMFVIGHELFNKSLTLDVENKLLQYMLSVQDVNRLNIMNSKQNPQGKYYTSQYFEQVFSKTWHLLHEMNPRLFPLESIIRDSALFKASPFHKLTLEQETAKREIVERVQYAMRQVTEVAQVIVVEGEAGSGKTVLMSNLFYELHRANSASTYLLVNHDQQLKVYTQIADKLGFNKVYTSVSKPTTFINQHQQQGIKVDVVMIDEAHLLWTQGKQSYRGQNQLHDIMQLAKVVVVVFDRKQVMNTNQYWDNMQVNQLIDHAKAANNHYYLKRQMRMTAADDTVSWIRKLVDQQCVEPLALNKGKDQTGYEVKVFDSPRELEQVIRAKNNDTYLGISRVVATFDWPYKDNAKKSIPESDWYYVMEGDWQMPWNKQMATPRQEQSLSWAEQPHTINEVGSTYTVQGFDLNYVGVIIGPSVKYRNGRIVFDKDSSCNAQATKKRTLADGRKEYVADELLRNELNVLLTRGVKGLYLYAVDKALNAALKNALVEVD